MFRDCFVYICFMTKYLTLFFLFTTIILFSQNPKTLDSLNGVWNDRAASDTSRLNAIGELVKCFQRSNPDSAISIAGEELAFAQHTKQTLWEAKACQSIGGLYYFKGNNAIAIEYYQKGLSVYLKLKDKKNAAQLLHQMGVVEYYDGTYDKAMNFDLQALKYFEGLNDVA